MSKARHIQQAEACASMERHANALCREATNAGLYHITQAAVAICQQLAELQSGFLILAEREQELADRNVGENI